MLFMKSLLIIAALSIGSLLPAEAPSEWRIGAAAVDVTLEFPVRLSGFGFRRAESEGVTQKIWAKALAIDDGQNGPAVLVTVDNLGVPWPMVQAVAKRLQKKTGLAPERFAVTATHTHTAPMLSGVAPTLFAQPIPAAHQQRIDRYTEKLTDWIEQAALEAIRDLQPGRLEWSPGSAGKVGFAKNRRTKGGPVDHDLPVLMARTAKGGIRAIYTSYACHCVTLSNNKISGDWAGYAQEWLQKNHPGAVALVSIGCGADQNPDTGVTGDNTVAASAQGRQIADEIARRLNGALTPITGKLKTTLGQVDLAFGTPPAKAEWESLAKRTDATGYHARVQLARLARSEALQTRLDYPIQTWRFGDELAMVFLPGEVVVDYSLRLKREFDRDRIWINAYANDAPCYIPSERILKEGGYEGAGAMVYYDRPTKLAVGLEDKIVGEIHRQLPGTFRQKKGHRRHKAKIARGVAALDSRQPRPAGRVGRRRAAGHRPGLDPLRPGRQNVGRRDARLSAWPPRRLRAGRPDRFFGGHRPRWVPRQADGVPRRLAVPVRRHCLAERCLDLRRAEYSLRRGHRRRWPRGHQAHVVFRFRHHELSGAG